MISNDGMKDELPTHSPVSHGMYPDEGKDTANPSSEETIHQIIPPSENEHKNESIYTGTCQKSNNN